MDLRFNTPLAFILLFLLPLVLETEVRSRLLNKIKFFRRKTQALPFSSVTPLNKLPSSFKSRTYSTVISSLRALSFFLLVLALARPQTTDAYTESLENGRDIMFVLDASKSMDALDFTIENKTTNRMEALKAVVSDFIKRRESDRMGLIVFGEKVFVQCPLTMDKSILLDFVQNLEIGMAGDATAMGDAITVALKRMRRIESKSKILVLITDGLKTAGSVEPIQAADIAKTMHVKIYTVGIGGTDRAPFRTTNIFGMETIEYRNVPLDEKTLMKIAEETGGKYFKAENTDQLISVYKEIDKLETRETKTLDYVNYHEEFFLPALYGFLLAILVECSQVIFYKSPT